MSQEIESSPAIRTFVLVDLETTGLLHRQGKSCRMIEMCFVAVLREHLLHLEFPRVLNKLSLMFNPHKFIDPESTNIHGKYSDGQSSEAYKIIEIKKEGKGAEYAKDFFFM